MVSTGMIALLWIAQAQAAPLGRVPLQPLSVSEFPQTVSLKTNRQSFNRKYYVFLYGGKIYYKANFEKTGIQEDWKLLPLLDNIEGKIVEVGVDDTYVIAITEDRQIHTLRGFLEEPEKFEWVSKSRWGSPLWFGKGMKLPDSFMSWDISYNSVPEDKYYIDSAGNKQSIGGGCTTLYALDITGQNIAYIDPWLPTDLSYRVCGPKRNAFVSQTISSSGSTLFLINKYGDMFVRTYDFDIAGGDWVFFPSTYEDVNDPNARFKFEFANWWRLPRKFMKRYLDGVSNKPRQIPIPDWARQEKIQGLITDKITITKEGEGGLKRYLRVEGIKDGKTGYFQTLARLSEVDKKGQPIHQTWQFVETGAPLEGKLIENLPYDSSHLTLGAVEEHHYVNDVEGAGAKAQYPFTVSVLNLDPYCSPAQLMIEFENGEKLELILHTRETIRQSPRQPGFTEEPLAMQAAVELPKALVKDFSLLGPASRWFIKNSFFEQKRFVDVKVKATSTQLTISGFAHTKIVLEKK